MKSLNVIIALLICATALISEEAVKDQKTVKGKAAAPVKTQPKVKETKEKGTPKIMGGPLMSVDAAKMTITVRVKSGEYPISVNSSTLIVAGDKKISFADLNGGDRVTVNYLKFKDGTRIATHINNKTAAAAKPKAEPKAEPKVEPKKEVKPPVKKEVQKAPEKAKKPVEKEVTPRKKK